jgi:hypothetical protein
MDRDKQRGLLYKAFLCLDFNQTAKSLPIDNLN